MSLFNHRRPLQRQSSLQNDLLTSPPSNRTIPNIRNHSANQKNLAGSLLKSNKAPLLGILRNKQRSEEHYQPRSTGSRSMSALGQTNKYNTKVSSEGRPNNSVKVAWGDDVLDLGEGNEGLEPLMTKKEVVLNRVLSSKLGRSSMRWGEKFAIASDREQELVLCSREQLAQRLKMAWQDRETSKRNLNIVLRPPPIKADDLLVEPDGCRGDQNIVTKEQHEECKSSTKIPIQEKETANIVDVTNIFHRTVRRRSFLKYEQPNQSNYEPSKNYENVATKRSSTILVIPIIENNLNNKERNATEDNSNTQMSPNLSDVQENGDKIKVEKVINIEANQKRELFQKRSNSNFHNTVDVPTNSIPIANKPKLIRASSVPSKYPRKPTEKPLQVAASARNANIIPKRRRIKSSTTFFKRNSSKHLSNTSDDSLTTSAIDNSRSVTSEQNYGSLNSQHIYQHSKDIVTMVSLLSPNITDNEEELDSMERQVSLVDGNKDNKTVMDKDAGQEKVQYGFTSLRKTVKSVSFQQSSIHSVRSFCVSFPGRRGSVGGTISNGTAQTINLKKASILQHGGPNGNKSQGQWGSFSEGDEGAGKPPKRRLVRTVSERNDGNNSEMSTSEQSTTNVMVTSQGQSPINDEVDGVNSQSPAVPEVLVTQTTVCEKEVYCMNTHRKLTDSGINISLETILRGMLTPTEYRLRCKREDTARILESQQQAEAVEELLQDNEK